MCWNEHISLNTFLFSSFVLGLIIYNNAFTKYKIQHLHNKWIYIFFASFIVIQLIEFFIWRNIDNYFYNNLFSILAVIVLFFQPIASLMIITEKKIRNILLGSYLLIAIPYLIYNFSTKHIYSIVSESGHLRWNFFELRPIIRWVVWVFFFLFSFFYEKEWFGFIFGLVTLIFTFLNYIKDNTVASMWCWIVNSIMIYYAFYLLIYLPFLERGNKL